MPIELIDIPAAVAEYLDTQVRTVISPVTPKKPNQDVLTPGQDGTCTVRVINAAAPDGVRLVNVVYHVKIDDGSVAELIAPATTLVRAFDRLASTTPLKSGTARTDMFVRLFASTILEAGASQPVLQLTVHCKGQGAARLTCHIHADVDQTDLFPNSQSPNGDQIITVA
jgi:hypothetical protein